MALKRGTPAVTLAETPAPAVTAVDQSTAPGESELPWEASPAPAPAAASAKPSPAVGTAITAARTDPPAVPAVPARANLLAPAGDDGFGSLDDGIGFGSFPIAKLDKDQFVIEDSSAPELSVVMLQARPKWIYRVDDEHLFYSYDQQTDTGGRSIESRYAEWEAEGVDASAVEVKKYQEVVARVAPGQKAFAKYEERLVLLSIPPASTSRLAGYRAELRIGGYQLSGVVTKCVKGPLVKISPKVSFYPWQFEMQSVVSD